ncbi:MAG: hypothetical protein IPG02_09050, partial [Ignavibacteria bacterium]|nr:hypothetical protein [Ignavibacteria bacterium]
TLSQTALRIPGIGSLTNLGTTGTELNQYVTGLSINGGSTNGVQEFNTIL